MENFKFVWIAALVVFCVIFVVFSIINSATRTEDSVAQAPPLDPIVDDDGINWAAQLRRPDVSEALTSASDLLTDMCAGLARQAGWDSLPREVGTELMLVVTEVAEAMEGHRKNLMDDHLPHRSMLEVEISDAIIRLYHFAGKYRLDVSGAIVEKLQYNTQREDHKMENRMQANGKKV